MVAAAACVARGDAHLVGFGPRRWCLRRPALLDDVADDTDVRQRRSVRAAARAARRAGPAPHRGSGVHRRDSPRVDRQRVNRGRAGRLLSQGFLSADHQNGLALRTWRVALRRAGPGLPVAVRGLGNRGAERLRRCVVAPVSGADLGLWLLDPVAVLRRGLVLFRLGRAGGLGRPLDPDGHRDLVFRRGSDSSVPGRPVQPPDTRCSGRAGRRAGSDIQRRTRPGAVPQSLHPVKPP